MAIAIAAAVAGSALTVTVAGVNLIAPAQSPPAVPSLQLTIRGTAVSALDGQVRAIRQGRVLAFSAALGEQVRAGDPLVEFVDLALAASKENLGRQIDEMRKEVSSTASDRVVTARSDTRRLQLAALRSLEESFEIARREFERWKTMNEEGLVARLEFERKRTEFAALEERLKTARSAAIPAEAGEGASEATVEPAELRRAMRLAERLDKLPESFFLDSPWDGEVREFHVQLGDIPDRRDPIATLARVTLPRLEASVGASVRILAVESACGIPGPLPFEIKDGVLRVTAPATQVRPGDQCEVQVRARE